IGSQLPCEQFGEAVGGRLGLRVGAKARIGLQRLVGTGEDDAAPTSLFHEWNRYAAGVDVREEVDRKRFLQLRAFQSLEWPGNERTDVGHQDVENSPKGSKSGLHALPHAMCDA